MKNSAILQKARNNRIISMVIIIILIGSILKLSSIAIKNTLIASRIKPLYKKNIVIDPGHGGIDGGTYFQDILEKDINLQIGLRLREELIKRGGRVAMTREIDESLERYVEDGSRHSRDLKSRVEIIRDNKADLFISIHVNHIRDSRRMGPIIFYNEENRDSKKLGEYIQTSLNKLSEYEKMGISLDRVALHGDYYILNNSPAPGVIIETGFISNEGDRKLLSKKGHQEEIADLIVKGIIEYFNEN